MQRNWIKCDVGLLTEVNWIWEDEKDIGWEQRMDFFLINPFKRRIYGDSTESRSSHPL